MNHSVKRKAESFIEVTGTSVSDSAIETGYEIAGLSEADIVRVLASKCGSFLPKTSKTRNFNIPTGYPHVVLFGNGHLREIFVTMDPHTKVFYGILVQRYNEQFKGYTDEEVREAYFEARMPPRAGEPVRKMKEKWAAITVMDEDHIYNATGSDIPAKTKQDAALLVLSRDEYAAWYTKHFPLHDVMSAEEAVENEIRREAQRLCNGFRVWVKHLKADDAGVEVARKEMLGIFPTGALLCRAIYDQQAVEDLCCAEGYYPWLKGHIERRAINIDKLQEIFVVTNAGETVYVKISTDRTADQILEDYFTAHPEERPAVIQPVATDDSDDAGPGVPGLPRLFGRMGAAISRFVDKGMARVHGLALGY